MRYADGSSGANLPNYLRIAATNHAAMLMALSTIQLACGACFRLMAKDDRTQSDGEALLNAIRRINSIASDLSDTLMLK